MIEAESVERMSEAVVHAVLRGPIERGDARGYWEVLDRREDLEVREALCSGLGVKLVKCFETDSYHAFAVDSSSLFAVSRDDFRNRLNDRVASKGGARRGGVPGEAQASIVHIVLLRAFFESGVERKFIELVDLYDKVEDFAKELARAEEGVENPSAAAMAAAAYRERPYGDGAEDRKRTQTKTGLVNEVVAEHARNGLMRRDGTKVVPTERFAVFARDAILAVSRIDELAAFFGKKDEEGEESDA